MSRKAIFISDAHLKRPTDRNYQSLLALLNNCSSGDKKDPNLMDLTDIFFLGDIFDFWFSRHEIFPPEFKAIVERMIFLGSQGVRIHLCEGNHDFYLSDFFGGVSGIYIYEDWSTFDLDGRKLLLGHGDLVDQANTRYIFMRRVLRSRLVYRLHKMVPIKLLWLCARVLSRMSKEFMDGEEGRIFKSMRAFAHEMFADGFDDVILGHCHVPHLEKIYTHGRERFFITTGDWVRHFSYVLYRDKDYKLCFWS
ncbi:MAG: UDP-2,3-diacylglucosamine diphosphatase [Syntrophales bacterium]|nr:UDP-2,3-diacylglucosamine diphosphatase [Syntrophales bacterium]